MPFKHKYKKVGRHLAGERPEVIIYRKEEECPPYVSISQLPGRINDMTIGDYAETLDGYVVPMIQDTVRKHPEVRYFRFVKFASMIQVAIPVTDIKRGAYFPIYRNENKYFHRSSYPFKKHTRLDPESKEFCWRVAQSFNPEKAVKEIWGHDNPGVMASRLMRKKKFAMA